MRKLLIIGGIVLALIAGVIGGLLWQVYGPTTAFLGRTAIVVLGLILFLFSAPKHSYRK